MHDAWLILAGFTLGGLAWAPLVAWLTLRARRRARRAVRRAIAAQRTSEFGSLGRGLAHEIKNPLSTIGLNAQLLAEAIEALPIEGAERERLTRRIGSLRREVDRLRGILEDFLRFAGEVRFEPRSVDLNALVEELADFYLPQAEQHGVRLRTDLARRLPSASADPAYLKQALLNLMINATQAIESAPGPDPVRRELVLRTSAGRDAEIGPVCRVSVADTGPGIDAGNLERLFKPYFTTKPGGAGLGLAITKRLVEEQGGRIDLETQPGHGATFTIVLPAAS